MLCLRWGRELSRCRPTSGDRCGSCTPRTSRAARADRHPHALHARARPDQGMGPTSTASARGPAGNGRSPIGWPSPSGCAGCATSGCCGSPRWCTRTGPSMAEWLNVWARDFARATPDCVQRRRSTPSHRRGGTSPTPSRTGARIFKAHVQVGDYDPTDPLLDPVWGVLAEAGVPVVVHAGSGPLPGIAHRPGEHRGRAAAVPRVATGHRAHGDARVLGVPRPGAAPSRRCTSTRRWRSRTSPSGQAPFPAAEHAAAGRPG